MSNAGIDFFSFFNNMGETALFALKPTQQTDSDGSNFQSRLLQLIYDTIVRPHLRETLHKKWLPSFDQLKKDQYYSNCNPSSVGLPWTQQL